MIILNNKQYKKKKYGIRISNNQSFGSQYPFIAESLAIFQRAKTEGFAIPSLITRIAIDNLIRDMMNFGVWNKLDLYFEFAFNGTAYSNFSLINWKNPTGPLGTITGGVIYTISGWRGNGIDGYINTNFNPTVGANNYVLNSACRFFTVHSNNSSIINLDGTVGSINNSWATGANQLRINGTGNSPSPSITGLGFRALARDSSTSCRVHVSSVISNVTSSSVAVLNASQLILRSNANFSDDGLSNYAMASSLTDTQLQNTRTAYNKYLVKIGLTAFA